MQKDHIAILWDLDGTIVDSKECHYKSWKAVFDKHGFPFSRSAYEENFGRNNQTALSIYLGYQPDRDLAEMIVEEKENIFRRNVGEESLLVPGVRAWLEAAQDRQFPQAVASSAPMENIVSTLASFKLRSYFDHLVSGAELPAKPEPDVFLEAARKVGHAPERCLVIEDSAPGVRAAKNAKMRCIAVATSRNDKSLASADLVIKDFTLPFAQALSVILS